MDSSCFLNERNGTRCHKNQFFPEKSSRLRGRDDSLRPRDKRAIEPALVTADARVRLRAGRQRHATCGYPLAKSLSIRESCSVPIVQSAPIASVPLEEPSSSAARRASARSFVIRAA